MNFLGMPLVGGWLPFIGYRRIYLNRDGSIVDTGKFLMDDERGPIYVQPFVIEWLGRGRAFPSRQPAYDSKTHKPIRTDTDEG